MSFYYFFILPDLFTKTKIEDNASCLLTHLRTLGSFSGQIKVLLEEKCRERLVLVYVHKAGRVHFNQPQFTLKYISI